MKEEGKLPIGKCCNDCVHVARCCSLFGKTPSDTFCDWVPERFSERREIGEQAITALRRVE